MHKYAKFNIGECVVHTQHGYRAVIVDVDPLFQASGRYNPLAAKKAFAGRNPWYRLLIDNTAQMTYVEERYLTSDCSQQAINNPKLADFSSPKRTH